VSDYTPSLDEVETHYHEWAAHLEATEPGTYPFRTWEEAMYGFRRWLAAHDAELRAEIAAQIRAVESFGKDDNYLLGHSVMQDHAAAIAEGKP